MYKINKIKYSTKIIFFSGIKIIDFILYNYDKIVIKNKNALFFNLINFIERKHIYLNFVINLVIFVVMKVSSKFELKSISIFQFELNFKNNIIFFIQFFLFVIKF